jgi:hypothetical protein
MMSGTKAITLLLASAAMSLLGFPAYSQGLIRIFKGREEIGAVPDWGRRRGRPRQLPLTDFATLP